MSKEKQNERARNNYCKRKQNQITPLLLNVNKIFPFTA